MNVQVMMRYFSPCCLGKVVAFVMLLLVPSALLAETRSLKIYYIHTKEKAEIAYKKDGRYLEAGLKKLNYLLRDWRRNEPTNMDPRLFDLIWQVYRLSGSRDYIHVVSAYRSPATNNMLRSRSASSGVAKNSQHTLGKALDFYLPDVNLAKLRGVGLKQEGGGVGYYPTSGSPFVHMDVGSVRHWPRMNRKELMALFPDGKTIHVPSDGKPLEGYNLALAAYNARKGALPSVVVAKESSREKVEKKSLFAGLFGKKRDKDNKEEVTTRVAVRDTTAAPSSGANGEERVVLPDADAPIPAFSPLKQAPRRDEAQEDEIGDLLVAAAALDDAAAPVETSGQMQAAAELGFVPIPLLKATPMQPSGTAVIAAQPVSPTTQTAYVPTLLPGARGILSPATRPGMPPKIKIEIPEQQPLETVIASAQDIIPLPEEPLRRGEQNPGFDGQAGKQDLAAIRLESQSADLAEIDRETIRAIIAEAMVLSEADGQMVASITPRASPKADKPRLDELGKLIAEDEAQRQAENYLGKEELHQIPELVFVSGLQKASKQPAVATLAGKAINFPPVARIERHD